MHSSERANLPQWKGQDGFYEIWFFVVFEPGEQRAYWFRYTTFAPTPDGGDDRRAILWAARFDANHPSKTIAVKTLLDDDDYDGGGKKSFHVRIGASDVGHGFCRGESSSDRHTISWELHFRPSEKTEPRMPPALDRLPLPVRAHHVHSEVEMDGWVNVDGERREVLGGTGVQMHVHGTRRVEELCWIYAPRWDYVAGAEAFATEDDRDPVLELTSARLSRRVAGLDAPRIASLFLRGDRSLERPSLRAARHIHVRSPRPGMLRVDAQLANRRVCVRSWADLDEFVGYRYRDPAGPELAVAQSDIASCAVDVYTRSNRWAPWAPVAQMRSNRGSALELHAPEGVEGIDYVSWADAELDGAERTPNASADEPDEDARRVCDDAGVRGERAPLPEPQAIYALGLTYREHADETSEQARTAVFRKGHDAWLPHGDAVKVPTSDELLTALDGLEPGLADEVRKRFAVLPPMMDYEVELAMVLLEGTDERKLRSGEPLRLGFFLANDLTSRSVQILGEGRPHSMAYWGLAKSLPGFLPVTPQMWVPEADESGHLPSVMLRTLVNGEVRQASRTDELSMRPREMLLRIVASTQRELHAGDVVLTGTPSGVAFSVSKLKRRIGDLLLDRCGKLKAAISAAAESSAFLGPGDEVEVEGGVLGRRRVRLTA